MIYPVFPSKSDTLGICAPSAGVGHKLDSFSLSEETFKSRGLNIKESESVRNACDPSASPELRGAEFNAMFADESVTAVYAATGGEYNIEMLPYIDAELVKNNPKWFVGYSDPTNIEFYMTTVMDIATIYGTNAGSFDWQPLHEFQENALDIFMGKIVEQHSYPLYDKRKDWDNICIDTPVSWDLYLPGQTQANNDVEFAARGRLIGGCMDVLDVLVGTPYEDAVGFVDRYSEDGFIWYFDIFEMSPFTVFLCLTQMKYAGWLKNVKAIIFGRVMYPGYATDEEYISQIRRALPDVSFIWGADIGHTKPAMTIINGAIGELNYKAAKASLKMELI